MKTRTLAAVAVVLLILVVGVVLLYVARAQVDTRLVPPTIASATSSPTPTPTATAAAATSSPAATPTPGPVAGCDNRYQQGDVPIVPPRTSGQFLQVALDSAVVIDSQQRTRWAVRFFVPSNAPGGAEIPLQAQITDAAGRPVQVVPEYQAGPPNAGSGPATSPITLVPCGAPRPSSGPVSGSVVVLIIQSAPIATGRYTLTLGPAKLPEGGTRGEVFDLSLTCDARPAPVGGVCR